MKTLENDCSAIQQENVNDAIFSLSHSKVCILVRERHYWLDTGIISFTPEQPGGNWTFIFFQDWITFISESISSLASLSSVAAQAELFWWLAITWGISLGGHEISVDVWHLSLVSFA